MRKKVLTPYEAAVEEFFAAAAEVRHARENFNHAEPQFVEIANAELTNAIEKFEIVNKKMRLLSAQ